VLAGAGCLGITWALIRANQIGWASTQTLVALVAGGLLVAAFLNWEGRTATPMLSAALFRSRGFNAANGVSFFMYASLFGVLFLMMQLLQTALGYSPLQAGLRTLPWTGAPMLVAPIAGVLADRYGGKPFMLTGLAMQAAGLGWIAAIAKPGMSYTWLAVALGVAGVGISLCFPTVANSAQREIGGVFGVAILAAVFAHPGDYSTPSTFIDHFKHAVWLGAAFSAIGIIAAAALPRRAQLQPGQAQPADAADHPVTAASVA
jgi:hypothetical protein